VWCGRAMQASRLSSTQLQRHKWLTRAELHAPPVPIVVASLDRGTASAATPLLYQVRGAVNSPRIAGPHFQSPTSHSGAHTRTLCTRTHNRISATTTTPFHPSAHALLPSASGRCAVSIAHALQQIPSACVHVLFVAQTFSVCALCYELHQREVALMAVEQEFAQVIGTVTKLGKCRLLRCSHCGPPSPHRSLQAARDVKRAVPPSCCRLRFVQSCPPLPTHVTPSINYAARIVRCATLISGCTLLCQCVCLCCAVLYCAVLRCAVLCRRGCSPHRRSWQTVAW
jgi:hypothetical protein